MKNRNLRLLRWMPYMMLKKGDPDFVQQKFGWIWWANSVLSEKSIKREFLSNFIQKSVHNLAFYTTPGSPPEAGYTTGVVPTLPRGSYHVHILMWNIFQGFSLSINGAYSTEISEF